LKRSQGFRDLEIDELLSRSKRNRGTDFFVLIDTVRLEQLTELSSRLLET
jgi:hypothetical protein